MIQIGTHLEQTGKSPFLDDVHRRQVVEGAVAGRHPAIGQFAIVRKQQAQVLVNGKQVADTFVLVAAAANRLAFAVAPQRSAIAGRQTKQAGLILDLRPLLKAI